MYIGLYLEKPIIKTGYYPEIDESKIKKYRNGSLEQSIKIGQFFFDNINDECETLVAPYEYDYWNSDQCKKIVNWIENNRELIKSFNLEEMFKVINDYCKQAVELDTGVEIEL
ncbi:MAG: hypothetical protein IIZ67_01450 [Bacilli bacterium]|nr:hypothetical protein [Bacilli bacterium]